MLKDYHHFKGENLSRSEKIQRRVTEMILESTIPDDKREKFLSATIGPEIKHALRS